MNKQINECELELIKEQPDKGKVYDFLANADNFFGELWSYKDYYDDEVPFFVRAYRRTLDLSFKLLSKGLVSKSQLARICGFQKRMLKLNKDFEKATKNKVKSINLFK